MILHIVLFGGILDISAYHVNVQLSEYNVNSQM